MLTLNTSRPTFFVADMVILVGRWSFRVADVVVADMVQTRAVRCILYSEV